MALIKSVREQFDDQAQFSILINYLKLNPSLNLECVHKVPQAMTDLKGVVSDQALNAFQIVCGLDQDL